MVKKATIYTKTALNKEWDEVYIPDWIIEQNGRKYIVEYFGLYGSDLYPGYTDKTKRKIELYSTVKEYQFIAIFPEDFKDDGFRRLERILREAQMEVVSELGNGCSIIEETYEFYRVVAYECVYSII